MVHALLSCVAFVAGNFNNIPQGCISGNGTIIGLERKHKDMFAFPLTRWPLGDLDSILKLQLSILFY